MLRPRLKICAGKLRLIYSQQGLRARFPTCLLRLACCFALLLALGEISPSWAVTPESPEVRKLIQDGLGYLEKHTDERLGGKCLVALAFLKDGASPDHPRVREALAACRGANADQILTSTVYGNGLAIIFLAELNPVKHRDLLGRFASAMAQRQKKHGGWGYSSSRTGDTSQTQYAALCYWELMRAGITPDVASVERCTNWLLRTQDPNGAWGYQGQDPDSFQLVQQRKTSVSMLAAGMGSTLICGKILGLLGPGVQSTPSSFSENPQDLPPALRRADQSQGKKQRTLSGNGVDRARLATAVKQGNLWMEKNFKIEWHSYPSYYLYSLERYKSFQELVEGHAPEEPEWYQQGYALLKDSQQPHGGWTSKVKPPCSTAFAVLFLLRSTQKSIKASLGEGTLVGGRGLSSNLANMKLRNGKLVTVRQEKTEVDQLLKMLEETDNDELESLLSDPTALGADEISADQTRRMRQVVRSGSPQSRRMAVRVLSRTRQLGEVPTLLFAMTDPDHRVVREARDGLRYISRRFEGFGLQDNFTDTDRYNALDHWKEWYRTLRPNSPLLP